MGDEKQKRGEKNKKKSGKNLARNKIQKKDYRLSNDELKLNIFLEIYFKLLNPFSKKKFCGEGRQRNERSNFLKNFYFSQNGF